MLEKKNTRVKRVSKSGVGAERVEREKGVKTRKLGEKGIQIIQIAMNSSHAIKRGKDR